MNHVFCRLRVNHDEFGGEPINGIRESKQKNCDLFQPSLRPHGARNRSCFLTFCDTFLGNLRLENQEEKEMLMCMFLRC